MSKFVEENINKKVTITPEELAKYYSSNPTEFHHPDLVRTSHILIQPAGDNPEQDAKAKERAEPFLPASKKAKILPVWQKKIPWMHLPPKAGI